MKNNFKKQLILTLLLTLATLSIAKTPEKPSVFQPLATGVSFKSERNNYQLMPGVFAKQKQKNNKNTLKTLSSTSQNIQILGNKGGLEIYRATNQLQSLNSGSSVQSTIAPSSNEKMVVFNPRTKNTGIVMGTIVIKYNDNSILKTLENDYAIKMVSNFNNIKFAFFTPNNIANIFSITAELKKDNRIISADIEILENINKLH